MKIIHSRPGQAISKFIFCLAISGNVVSFTRLIWNTKKYKWSKKSTADREVSNEAAEMYQFKVNKQYLPVLMRTYSGDLPIFFEIFWNKVYEIPAECYKNVKTIVDLGANIGLASLYFQQKCPDAVIYAVEPEPSNYELLLQNVHTGTPKQVIFPIHAAIDATDGVASIQVENLRYNSSIVPLDQSKQRVRTISLKTLMRAHSIERIDILKIDIEGAEERLFEANTDWLQQVKYLIIEFHSASGKAMCMKLFHLQNYTVNSLNSENDCNGVFLITNNRLV